MHSKIKEGMEKDAITLIDSYMKKNVIKELSKSQKLEVPKTLVSEEISRIDKENNPNGALKNIAGIFNKDKNILGMMPHPERMIDPFLSGEDGSLFFKNLIGSI